MRRTTLFWLDDVRRDVSYAARGLARNTGFATAAVVTLALGIGEIVARQKEGWGYIKAVAH